MRGYFALLSDTHFGAAPDYLHRGYRPFEQFQSLKERFGELFRRASFSLHLGDVAGDKDFHCCDSSAALAAAELKSLETPLYWLVGNHDELALLEPRLGLPEHERIELGREALCYRFSNLGLEFLALHSSIAGRRAGELCEKQWEVLESCLSAPSEAPLVIMLHHLPLACDSPWMNEFMLLGEGDRFHRMLSASNRKIFGCFFGHVHDCFSKVYDGVPYYAVPPSIFQFDHELSVEKSIVREDSKPGMYLASVSSSGLQVSARFSSSSFSAE